MSSKAYNSLGVPAAPPPPQGGASQYMDEVWERALSMLHGMYSSAVFDTWISTLSPVYYDENFFVLHTEQEFFRPTLEQRYLKDINTAVRSASGRDFSVRLQSPGSAERAAHEVKLQDRITRANLGPRYVFSTFVRGKTNEFAHAAAVAVAEHPGSTHYNPLFIYGGVGLGKTHLMQAIGNYIVVNNPESKVLYVQSETFMNELIASIRSGKNLDFRNKYRTNDVLLIDDIQFIEQKESTQEELFHTFNTMYEAGKQIVITSDQPPRDLKTLEDRLRSRFGWGLVADITLPDFETRTAILEKKAEDDGIRISLDILHYLSKNIVSNVRDLEGALNKLTAMTRLSDHEMTLGLAQTVVGEIMSYMEKREITTSYIQEVVADYYQLTVDDIKSRKRTQKVAYPRQIAMYLTRKLLNESASNIGRSFLKDHSTILHGCEKISHDMEQDVHLRNVLMELEDRIKG